MTNEIYEKFSTPGSYVYYLMEKNNLSIRGLGKYLNVSRGSIQKLIYDEKRITPDMALRLGKCFNTSPEFWLDYSREREIKENFEKIKNDLEKIKPLIQDK